MLASLFFSYSHRDERLRDQLEMHLSSLRRQGLISTWHDRRIVAGSDVDESIDENLNSADVILLLVSPDFIASDYCYEREVARAIQRHKDGKAKVISVILRPCDWRELPIGSERRASIAATSSISETVVRSYPPDISRRLVPFITTTPQPPGPGFPIAEPSVKTR
jgi:hypothetical protein